MNYFRDATIIACVFIIMMLFIRMMHDISTIADTFKYSSIRVINQ